MGVNVFYAHNNGRVCVLCARQWACMCFMHTTMGVYVFYAHNNGRVCVLCTQQWACIFICSQHFNGKQVIPYVCAKEGTQTSLGLARTINIRCIYGTFGREITEYTVIYGVYIQFWPTLHITHKVGHVLVCTLYVWLFICSHRVWQYICSHFVWQYICSHCVWQYICSHRVWQYICSHPADSIFAVTLLRYCDSTYVSKVYKKRPWVITYWNKNKWQRGDTEAPTGYDFCMPQGMCPYWQFSWLFQNFWFQKPRSLKTPVLGHVFNEP
jgi:hypothetical protein